MESSCLCFKCFEFAWLFSSLHFCHHTKIKPDTFDISKRIFWYFFYLYRSARCTLCAVKGLTCSYKRLQSASLQATCVANPRSGCGSTAPLKKNLPSRGRKPSSCFHHRALRRRNEVRNPPQKPPFLARRRVAYCLAAPPPRTPPSRPPSRPLLAPPAAPSAAPAAPAAPPAAASPPAAALPPPRTPPRTPSRRSVIWLVAAPTSRLPPATLSRIPVTASRPPTFPRRSSRRPGLRETS